MPITPFTIVNPDGSINQNEYERCIKFLNDYTNGSVPVYQTSTWTQPLEVDTTVQVPANIIVSQVVENNSNNRLLTAKAFEDLKNMCIGMVSRAGTTLHTAYGYYIASKDFEDGPGYMYDVFNLTQDNRVYLYKTDTIHGIYHLMDKYHTVLDGDGGYDINSVNNRFIPNTNLPSIYGGNGLESNMSYIPENSGNGIPCIYDAAYELSNNNNSALMFYYSKCNDKLYTNNESYVDDRLAMEVNFTSDKSELNYIKYATGIDNNKIQQCRDAILGDIDSEFRYIPPNNTNSDITYISPNTFLALDSTEWYL